MKSNLPRRLDSFSEYREEKALSHELPYWDLLDDTIILADGTFVQGLTLQGPSIETWTADSINQLTIDTRAFLNSLPDGCELGFFYDVNSDFRDILAKHESLKGEKPLRAWLTETRIECLRNDAKQSLLLHPKCHLFVYKRFEAAQRKTLSSFFSAPQKFVSLKKDEHEKCLKEINELTSGISTSLEHLGIQSKRLSGGEITDLIYRFLNPSGSQTHPFPNNNFQYKDQEFHPEELQKEPALQYPTLREQLCFSDVVCGYDSFFMDAYYHRLISLKTLPETTHAALVSRLSQLEFPYSLHLHIRVPEQSKELSSLQARRRMAHSMSVSTGGRAVNLESEARLNASEDLLREILSTGQKIFYVQCVVLVRAKSREELDSMTHATLAKFRELNGAEALAENIAGFKLWKTILPFGNVTQVRPKRMKTDNLADFIPLYQPYGGPHDARPVCLFKNRQLGLVKYDPFNPKLPNYNALVTGSSGAGKSFVNNLILLQYATQDPAIFIIDIGGSYRKLCEFLGGTYLEIGPPEGDQFTSINPFELPLGQNAPSSSKLKFLLALIETMLSEEGRGLDKLNKSLIEESLVELYALKKTGRSPFLSDFRNLLSISENSELKRFSKMLYPWTGDRPYGKLLDKKSSLDVNSDVVVFDLKGLSAYPDLQSVMFLILTDFILQKVDLLKSKRKQILMDECWELLKSPNAQNFMEYCVRTLRKTGSGITFITQGLDEIVKSPIGSAILANTATKFVLTQRGDIEPAKKILKLNDQETSLIASLRQSKGEFSEAFLIANEERAIIRIAPTTIECWLSTSDPADNEVFEAQRKENPQLSFAAIIHGLATKYPKGVS